MVSFKTLLESIEYSDFNNYLNDFVSSLDFETKLEYTKKGKNPLIRIRIPYDSLRTEVTDEFEKFLIKNRIPYERKFLKSYSTSVDTFTIPTTSGPVRVVVKPKTSASKTTQKDEQFQVDLLNKYKYGLNLNDLKQEVENEIANNEELKPFKNSFISRTQEILKYIGPEARSLTFIRHPEKGTKANSTQEKQALDFVNNLMKVFNKVNKKEGNYFINRNKWNPADIWAVNTSSIPQMENELKNVKSFNDLNSLLKKWIEDRKLIGISLKQTGKTAKVSEENFDSKKFDFGNVEVWSSQKSKNLEDSKGIVLKSKNGMIQFRTAQNLTTFRGEILGKHARHGNIGVKNISNIIGSITGNYSFSSIAKDANYVEKYRGKQIDWNDKKIQQMYNEIKTIGKKFGMSFNDEKLRQKLSNPDYFYSKYLAMKAIDLVGQKNMNEFFERVYSLASSKTEKSAPYIKVY